MVLLVSSPPVQVLLGARLGNTHILLSQQSSGSLSVVSEIDSCRSTFMVRVFTLFLSIIIYLHCSVHCRTRALVVPINSRDPVNSLSLCLGDVLEASNPKGRIHKDASSRNRWEHFSLSVLVFDHDMVQTLTSSHPLRLHCHFRPDNG